MTRKSMIRQRGNKPVYRSFIFIAALLCTGVFRGVFAGVLAVVFAGTLAGCCRNQPEQVQVAEEEPLTAKKKLFREKWHDLDIIGDWTLDMSVLRMLSSVWHGMGDIGEILDTAGRIRGTSELSWFREWYKTAERIKAVGDESLSGGHRISAGEAYMRASNYYRAAEFFLHADPSDPRILDTYKKCAEAFLSGAELLSIPVELVQIPYEGTTLRGHFYTAAVNGKAPILIVNQGFDGAMEETKYVAEAAAKRGYHCLIFEGPGQGLSIREQNLTFRPDWENVITPVVDYCVGRPEVDADRMALLGISFGGGFVVRAAAFEERLKIVIANPGYLNIAQVFFDVFDAIDPKLLTLLEEDPEAFNEKMEDLTGHTSMGVSGRWGFNDGMWKFGADSPAEYLRKMKEFSNEDIIDRIDCIMLIMDGTAEVVGEGQAKELYDMLNCPKHYMLFTEEEAAALHCQNGNLSIGVQRMFDWFDDHI